jgi:hypothetical protein
MTYTAFDMIHTMERNFGFKAPPPDEGVSHRFWLLTALSRLITR